MKILPSLLLSMFALCGCDHVKKGRGHSGGVVRLRECLVSGGVGDKFVGRDDVVGGYSGLNKQWNSRRETVYPLGYFIPTTSQDVSVFVKCGVKGNIRIVANSGGHSYESTGFGNNNTLIVDFRNMKSIQVVEGSGGDGGVGVGVLEPGALVGQINAHLWENGGYFLPMGNCLSVGIGGHILGGGVGYFSGLYGLALDNVIEFEMVDATGEIEVVNQQNNPSLFWALRGSGPLSLGIITKITTKLHQATDLKITFVMMMYPVKLFPQAFLAFQKFQTWVGKKEPTVVAGLVLTSDVLPPSSPAMTQGVMIFAVHIQDPLKQPKGNAGFLKAANEIFPKTGLILPPFNVNYIQFLGMTSYASVRLPSPRTGEMVTANRFSMFYEEKNPLAIPDEKLVLEFLKMMKKEDKTSHYFKAKSMYIKDHFSFAQLEKVGKVMMKIPTGNFWLLLLSEQGAVRDIPKNGTSYVHRDSLWNLVMHYDAEGSPEPEQIKTGMEFLQEAWDAMLFMDSGESYQNYLDYDLKDLPDRFYKDNWDKLMAEKKKWDPTNYFYTELFTPPKKNGGGPHVGTNILNIILCSGLSYLIISIH